MADEDRKNLDPETLDPDSLEADELDQAAGGAAEDAVEPGTDPTDHNVNCCCTCPPTW